MHSEVTKCTRRLHNYLKQAKTHKPNQYVQKLQQNGPRAIFGHSPRDPKLLDIYCQGFLAFVPIGDGCRHKQFYNA